MKARTTLLVGMSLLLAIAMAEASAGSKAWNRLLTEVRERATLVLSGEYFERTDPGALVELPRRGR